MLEFATDLPFDCALVLLQTEPPEAEENSSQSRRLIQYSGNLAQT